MPVVARTATPLDNLLGRASTYVCAYVHDFSTVVAEEQYVQDSHPMPRSEGFGMMVSAGPSQHARLRSDLLFVGAEYV